MPPQAREALFSPCLSVRASTFRMAAGARECITAKIAIISQYLAPLHAVNGSTAKYNILSCDEPWQVYDTGRGVSLLIAGNDDEVFMTRSQSTLRRDNTAASNCMHW